MREELKAGLIVIAAVLAIIIVGTVGYTLIDGWSLLDSLYMTVITVFTVGFGEVHPLSRAGQIFTMLLIIGGVGIILYGIGRMVEFAIDGEVSGMFRRRAVRRQVDKLDAHFIVCGYGRVGRAVAQQFAAEGAPFVVVDNDQGNAGRAEAEGCLVMHGDATADEILEVAGIARAKGLVAALGSEAGNIFLALSARVLNPKLLIVARAASDDTVNKLMRAGADHVVTPYGLGGKRMATLMLKPLVSDYLEVVTGGGELELMGDCCVIGRTIGDMEVRARTGATILALRRAVSGSFETNPAPASPLNPGDRIIAIGTPGQITKLEELIAAPNATHS